MSAVCFAVNVEGKVNKMSEQSDDAVDECKPTCYSIENVRCCVNAARLMSSLLLMNCVVKQCQKVSCAMASLLRGGRGKVQSCSSLEGGGRKPTPYFLGGFSECAVCSSVRSGVESQPPEVFHAFLSLQIASTGN